MEIKLYVRGLPENSGPGDLVDAITSQAGIGGNEIGGINVKGSVDTVFVPEDVTGSVVENLENVSGEPVSVARASPYTRLIRGSSITFPEIAKF